jgi:hypothetical protein
MKPGELLQAVSLVVGIFSFTIGIVTLMRYRESPGVAVDIPRVSYSDGVFVDVREGAWYRLEDFVQPNDPTVRQVVRQLV